jgi:dihydrofolate synthase/folylpolyglutamate synthase
MNYRQSIAYLESFKKSGIRLGLERIRLLLEHLGDPQNSFRSIHIAGTNGKGSVAAMLSSILNQAGYKVGLYTSPHLVDYTERLRINEKNISKKKFAQAVNKVKNIIKNLPKLNLTEFEVLTALSFLLLKQEKVEITVIETGLGGRLDATNIIMPILSIITNIDYDHMDVLGISIRKIALEKAGIIKSGIPLVTGEKKLWQILRKACKRSGSRFIRANDRNIKYSPFNGKHQIENTKVALKAIEVLQKNGFRINSSQINNGLRKAFWPGRIQVISNKPLIILDGAHNPAGARALRDYLASKKRRFNFIIGMQANKDIKKFIDILKPIARKIVSVRSSNPGAIPAERIPDSIPSKKLKIAVKMAKYPLCITGSLYLVGDVLREKPFDL